MVDGTNTIIWSWAVSSWLVLAAGCTAGIIYTDIRWVWIPDRAVVVFAVSNVTAWAAGLVHPDGVTVLTIALAFIGIYILYPRGLGSGDVKLALALCLGCPGQGAYVMILLAVFFALITAGVIWFRARQTMLPFGPCLLAGWWLALFFGQTCAAWLGWQP